MHNEKEQTIQRQLSVVLRPTSLDNFIGSPKVIKEIKTFISDKRIPTAFLISGPTGCGKTTLARCINTALNGEMIEANAADDTGVTSARELGDQASYRPLMGDYKVIILDEAHQLTKAAQSALLKHVEDAPISTIWIFCTTEPSKLLPTLRGRCSSFVLGGLTDEDIWKLLLRSAAFIYGNPQIEFNYLLLGVHLQKWNELKNCLISNNIRAPRSILNCVERFKISGADPLDAVFGSGDSRNAFEIAKAASKPGNWSIISKLLTDITTEEAMTARIICANYFKSALLRGIDTDFYSKAIIELTKNIPAIDVFGLPELSARLYNISKLPKI